MTKQPLFVFALRSNVAFYGLIAVWMFAVGSLSAGSFRTSGFFSWGLLCLGVAALAWFTVRGLNKQQSWAWFSATLIALLNLWAAIRCLWSFSGSISSVGLGRQIGAAAFIFYFSFSAVTILAGLYFRRSSADQPAQSPAEDSPAATELSDD